MSKTQLDLPRIPAGYRWSIFKWTHGDPRKIPMMVRLERRNRLGFWVTEAEQGAKAHRITIESTAYLVLGRVRRQRRALQHRKNKSPQFEGIYSGGDA